VAGGIYSRIRDYILSFMGSRFRVLTIAVPLFLAVSPVLAQQPAAPTPASQSVAADVMLAPVVIDGERLFFVRGVSALPADRRAREIEGRIRAVAVDRNIATASLTIDDQPEVSWIQAGRQRIMGVIDEDGALEQLGRPLLARAYLQRIHAAIDSYRAARVPSLLAWHAVYAVAATLLLIAGAFGGRRVVGWLRGAVEARFQSRVRDVQIQAFQIVRAKQIWALVGGLLNLAWAVAVVVILFAYLRYVFGLFPWTRGLSIGLLEITVGPLETLATGFIREVPNLVFLLVLVLVMRFILKFVRFFFQSVSEGAVKLHSFDAEWAPHTYRLVRTLLIALAVIVAYPYVPGSDSEAFKGVSLFIGLIFSLGSSSLIGNVIAGYSMIYRRAFKTGDRVKVGDHLGEVLSTRLLVTHLRTPKNEVVVVPNSTILGSEIVNYTSLAQDRGLILHTRVSINYSTPWRQVEAMLIEAASRTPGLLREPAPFVLQRALGDFAVTYELNAYCRTPEHMHALYAEMHRNILDVFNEYGVQIMTPAYEGDPAEPKVVPKTEWYPAPAKKEK
jgi:small-conductance mechanosensitive channel